MKSDMEGWDTPNMCKRDMPDKDWMDRKLYKIVSLC